MTLIIQRPTGSNLVLAKDFTWNETVWNPGMISTEIWLDANDASTVATSGATVSSWLDKSGRGNNFTANGNPQYETTGLSSLKPAIALDGTGDYFVSAVKRLDTFNAFDVFFVFQSALAAAPDTDSVTLFGLGDASTSTAATVLSSSTGALSGELITFGYNRGLSVGRLGASSGYTRPSNTAQILNSRQSTTGYSLLANGSTIVLDLSSGGLSATSNTAPSNITIANNNLYIGGLFAGTPIASAAAKLSEVVISSSILSTVDRQKTEGYLAHKWGLTADLPSGHPYKLVGPTP